MKPREGKNNEKNCFDGYFYTFVEMELKFLFLSDLQDMKQYWLWGSHMASSDGQEIAKGMSR